MRHAKELKILVWPLCNELGSVLRNFYEELVHILVKKVHSLTHTQQTSQEGLEGKYIHRLHYLC